MVKWFSGVAIVLYLSTTVSAQVRFRAPSVATLPAVCLVGDLAVKITAVAGLYVCTAVNTWILVGSSVTDATITVSDITTNNASANKHGWLPKLPSNTTTFLRGDGTFTAASTAPSGSDTQVQFNDGSAFGGSAFTYNKTAQTYTFTSKLPNIDASALLPAPALAGLGTGNLSNGVYSYKFTQLDNDGNETAAGTATASVTVVDATMNGQVTVTQPFSCSGTYSPVYNLYRTVAGGSVYKYVDQLNYTCSLTYTDNMADALLGANAPSANATSVASSWNGVSFAGPNDSTSNNGLTQEFGDGTQNITFAVSPSPVGAKSFNIIGQDGGQAGGGISIAGGQGNSSSGGGISIAGGRSYGSSGGNFTSTGGRGITTGGNWTSEAGIGGVTGGDWKGYAGYGATTNGVWRAGTYTGNTSVDHIVITGTNTNITPTLSVGGASMLPILSGTSSAIGGGSLTAGTCASGTAAVTGATTAMAVVATPVTYPGDGTDWSAYVSAADTVTVKVCALVVVTPVSSNYNVRVLQ